jgi:hypothetical protein
MILSYLSRVYIVNKTQLLKGKLVVNQSVNHLLLKIYQKNKWRHTTSASVWIEQYAYITGSSLDSYSNYIRIKYNSFINFNLLKD